MRARLRRAWASIKDAAGFVRERPERMVAVAGALLAGLIIGAPIGDAGYDYTWRDPYFCDDCHVHDYADEAWARSIHAGMTTCHDCHKVPVSHYPVMTLGAIFARPQSPEEVKKAHVPNILCEACHVAASTEHLTGPMTDEMRAQIVKIDDSVLHRAHLDSKTREPGAYLGEGHGTEGAAEPEPNPHHDDEEGESAIKCLDCHGSGGNEEAHRFTAARSNCLSCHTTLDVSVGRLTELRCRECHYTGFIGAPGEVASAQ